MSRRILHTMLRVGDLQRSLDFYTGVMGMQVLRSTENAEYEYTLAFVGYQEESEAAVLELTWNWGTTEYELGNAYGHIAIAVEDIYATCETIRKAGGVITREPGPVKGGTTEIAFIRDPDGYMIELIDAKYSGKGLG